MMLQDKNASKAEPGNAVPRPASLALLPVLLALAGCHGMPSEQAPIHWIQNMQFQTVFKPQSENTFFADKRAQRSPIAGTVPHGVWSEDVVFNTGKTEKGDYATNLPKGFPLTIESVHHGRDRYQIYCVPCHGSAGYGDGIVATRGLPPPANFHADASLAFPAGRIYSAIANGVNNGNMPAYTVIPVEDRWAIVEYVRALQMQRTATLADVPPETATEKGWTR